MQSFDSVQYSVTDRQPRWNVITLNDHLVINNVTVKWITYDILFAYVVIVSRY